MKKHKNIHKTIKTARIFLGTAILLSCSHSSSSLPIRFSFKINKQIKISLNLCDDVANMRGGSEFLWINLTNRSSSSERDGVAAVILQAAAVRMETLHLLGL